MATFLEGFRRLSSELEISERRLCQELGMDQSRLSALRRRLAADKAVQGLQIDVLVAIKLQFPQANLNAFFDNNTRFFTRSAVATESLLDKVKAQEEQIKLLQDIITLYKNQKT